MPLVPLSVFARRVGGHPDVLVGLLNNLGCPLVSENAVLHVDDNIALAVLRAKGLISDGHSQRRGQAPRQIGFSQDESTLDPDAPDAVAEDSDASNGERPSGDDRREGRPPRRSSDDGADPIGRRRRR